MDRVTYKIFDPGDVYATPGALDAFDREELLTCLQRHALCDWGDLCREDWETNEDALAEGGRLMSVYKLGGRTLWIITEWDRSATTMLLPEEY